MGRDEVLNRLTLPKKRGTTAVLESTYLIISKSFGSET